MAQPGQVGKVRAQQASRLIVTQLEPDRSATTPLEPLYTALVKLSAAANVNETAGHGLARGYWRSIAEREGRCALPGAPFE